MSTRIVLDGSRAEQAASFQRRSSNSSSSSGSGGSSVSKPAIPPKPKLTLTTETASKLLSHTKSIDHQAYSYDDIISSLKERLKSSQEHEDDENNQSSLLDEIYAEIEEKQHHVQVTSNIVKPSPVLDVNNSSKNVKHDNSSNYSSSSSYSCSSTYSSNTPPLPTVPPPPLTNAKDEIEAAVAEFKRISMSLEEEIEMEIRNKLMTDIKLKRKESKESEKNVSITSQNESSRGGSEKKQDDDTLSNLSTVEYLEPILFSKTGLGKTQLDNRSLHKLLSSNNNNVNHQTSLSHRFNLNIDSLFISPAKLKSYIIKASPNGHSSHGGSSSVTGSSMSQASNSISSSVSSTSNRQSLTNLLKSNKITSTLKMIKNRHSTSMSTTASSTPSTIESMPASPALSNPISIHNLFTSNDSTGIPNKYNTVKASKRNHLRRQTAIVSFTSSSSSTTSSSNPTIEISQPKLISQTFDLSKQNLIDVKKNERGTEASMEYGNDENNMVDGNNNNFSLHYSSYSSFSSASDSGSASPSVRKTTSISESSSAKDQTGVNANDRNDDCIPDDKCDDEAKNQDSSFDDGTLMPISLISSSRLIMTCSF